MDDIATCSGTIPVYFVVFSTLVSSIKETKLCFGLSFVGSLVVLNTRVQTNGC